MADWNLNSDEFMALMAQYGIGPDGQSYSRNTQGGSLTLPNGQQWTPAGDNSGFQYVDPSQQYAEYATRFGEDLDTYGDRGYQGPAMLTRDEWIQQNDATPYWQVGSDNMGYGMGSDTKDFSIKYRDDGNGNMVPVEDPRLAKHRNNDLEKQFLAGAGLLAGGGMALNAAGFGGAAGAGAAGAAGTGVTVGGPMTFGNVAGQVVASDLGLLGAAGGAAAAGGGSVASGAAGGGGLLSSASGAGGTLGSVGTFLKDNKDLIGLGVTGLGGLLGAASGGDTTKTTTDEKAPWSAAQPYLKENLATNKTLQDYYAQNPFNDQQKQSYENIFSDLNNFRSNTAPGLMDFANNAMTGGYQRPQYSAPGTAGYGGTRAPVAQQPGPFSVTPGSYELPDWLKMNPFKG